MSELLSFEEFKIKHAKDAHKWAKHTRQLQEFNIPVVLRWCEMNCIGDYCIKMASWARNVDRNYANRLTADFIVLFQKTEDKVAIARDIGKFWEPKEFTYQGVSSDREYISIFK